MSLTFKQKSVIEDNYSKMSPKGIAAKIKSKEKDVIDYIVNVMKMQPLIEEEFDEGLRAKPEWEHYKQEFSPEELKLFEHSYKQFIDQFGGNVLATEEKQIFQAIELELFMHQNKQKRKFAEDEIKRIRAELQIEADMDPEERDKGRIDLLRTQLATFTASMPATSKEYNEFSKKHAEILGELKATRAQRIKQIEEGKVNFLGLIKDLEKEEKRKKEMIQSEIMKAAMLEHEKKYSQSHEYADKTYDIPILNPETMSKDE
jgi:hypothetical protein